MDKYLSFRNKAILCVMALNTDDNVKIIVILPMLDKFVQSIKLKKSFFYPYKFIYLSFVLSAQVSDNPNRCSSVQRS